MKIRSTNPSRGIVLDMTPMIDIVFQLLAFFIFTLRITAAEGDFSIQMPLTQPGPGMPEHLFPPLQIHLRASAQGDLEQIRLNDLPLADFASLRQRVRALAGDGSELATELEVELDCDEQLAYQHVISAITAVSGERDHAGNVTPLVRKIRFLPRHARG